MGNPFPAFHAGLRAAISATWPDIQSGSDQPIYRFGQRARIAWKAILEQANNQYPYAVIFLSDVPQATSWGLNNTIWTPRVEIFYITKAVASEPDMSAYLEEQLMALRQTLLTWSTGFQFAYDASIEVGTASAVQQALLAENMDLFVGSIAFDVRVSDSGDSQLLFFDPRQLSVCKLEPFTLTTNAGVTTATTNTGAAVDLLTMVDAIAYNPTQTVSDYANEDAPIMDYRSGGKNDFTLSIGAIDGQGRSQPLMDLWHQGKDALKFSLRAKNLDGTDGKWLILVGIPATLKNGVVAGKSATFMTFKPTWGVMPYWGMTPPAL
ncbi:hypothetical protein [Armatimonas rosea]|uniref:Uncharacterized protein n=1 Tax=Armatimonas rosea TaxID=685828 RepID=A0A7W9WA64_ARMRO|nr:hypothetical protein [Armatimonas rosea]MBB6053282.1 hypothetical protein [Armatimonas rosea]